MNRVTCLASLLLLAASQPAAAGGKDVIREALSRAQGSGSSQSQPRAQPQPQPQRQSQPVRQSEQRTPPQRRWEPDPPRQQSEPRQAAQYRQVETRQDRSGLFRRIAEQVVARGEPQRSRWTYYDYWGNYYGAFGAVGAFGAPGFYGWNSNYDRLTNDELWEICMGQRRSPFFFRRSTACRLLSSPNLRRRVDTPYYLERGTSSETEEWSVEATQYKSDPRENAEASPDDSLAPCNVNETLARKRPQRECTGPGPEPEAVE